MARKYFDKLFKEYAIVDLSHYKEGKIGMRWRVEKEVMVGKGQFVCGAKVCDERKDLESFEVPFGYEEAGKRKSTLVKARLCPRCAKKLLHKYPLARKQHKRLKSHNHDSSEGSETPQSERSTSEVAEESVEVVAKPVERSSNDPWKKKPEMEQSLGDEFEEYFNQMCGDLLV
eukprot:c5478_g1_i1.p1 GENE.c5478_g1_i1~~c5478_g1_i1.p1  ORF type:complete len:173 (+),score=31.69 c5478_g1_i1:541-1059(+)